MKYISGLGRKHECFICHNIIDVDNDRENLLLWRTEHCAVMFNKFPYNNGHLLIAPKRHVADLDPLTDAEMLEMTRSVRQVQHILKKAVNPGGFNVGINFGRCGGAGLPEHMHIHVVPRWDGDTNFMSVCTDVKVISQSLFELYDMLKDISQKEALP
jgi:ATP adenylyltransferase